MSIPLNIDWQQILLHLLNFVILAGGLYLLLYKPVKDFMAKREEHYRAVERQAQEKLSQAEDLSRQRQEQLKQLEDELRQRRMQAQKKLEQDTQQQLSQAREQADQIIADAHTAARREREKLLEDTRRELEELAVSAAGELLSQSGGDPYDQFLTLAERGQDHERQP